jgi:hypothetical protein
MKWWHRGYTKRWLDRQGFASQIFHPSVDGAKLCLLGKLSFFAFTNEFLTPGSWLPESEWMRLKKLTKSLGSDGVGWPAISLMRP